MQGGNAKVLADLSAVLECDGNRMAEKVRKCFRDKDDPSSIDLKSAVSCCIGKVVYLTRIEIRTKCWRHLYLHLSRMMPADICKILTKRAYPMIQGAGTQEAGA